METMEATILRSLDGGSDQLYEFLPYLLQDLWELGAAPELVVKMVQTHLEGDRIHGLDLGCGKGAVTIRLAQELGCQMKGIDGVKEFIEYAEAKAKDYGVGAICEFNLGDIRQSVTEERGYDFVILGACGDVLGDWDSTIGALKRVTKSKGWLIIDDAFAEDGQPGDGYASHRELMSFFAKHQVELIEEIIIAEDVAQEINRFNNQHIRQRAAELREKHPEKSAIFDDYVQKQLIESEVLENKVKCATWLLRKVE